LAGIHTHANDECSAHDVLYRFLFLLFDGVTWPYHWFATLTDSPVIFLLYYFDLYGVLSWFGTAAVRRRLTTMVIFHNYPARLKGMLPLTYSSKRWATRPHFLPGRAV